MYAYGGGSLNISQVSKSSGLSIKAIRYYEEMGLVVPARDVKNSYRTYTRQNLDQLTFLRKARAVGFDLDVCRELLGFYQDASHRTNQVKTLILEKMRELEQQSEMLDAMYKALATMVSECRGDEPEPSLVEGVVATQLPVFAKPASITFTVLGEQDAE